MHRCAVCHFETNPDDIAVEGAGGLLVCLVCYGHLTETRIAVPKGLRRELETCLRDLVLHA
jgi:hypothetical protein